MNDLEDATRQAIAALDRATLWARVGTVVFVILIVIGLVVLAWETYELVV